MKNLFKQTIANVNKTARMVRDTAVQGRKDLTNTFVTVVPAEKAQAVMLLATGICQGANLIVSTALYKKHPTASKAYGVISAALTYRVMVRANDAVIDGYIAKSEEAQKRKAEAAQTA